MNIRAEHWGQLSAHALTTRGSFFFFAWPHRETHTVTLALNGCNSQVSVTSQVLNECGQIVFFLIFFCHGCAKLSEAELLPPGEWEHMGTCHRGATGNTTACPTKSGSHIAQEGCVDMTTVSKVEQRCARKLVRKLFVS